MQKLTSPWLRKTTKVKWELCYIDKEVGGLGIKSITTLDDRMAAKWILKSFFHPIEKCAWLINMSIQQFTLKGNHKWKQLPLSTILFSKYEINPRGSPLIRSIWSAVTNSRNTWSSHLILKKVEVSTQL